MIMFESDLLLAFIFMALLFLRQIIILKRPNKINYAPLMIGIGAISSVVHFIIHPDASDVILLLRESFFPLLVALLLYIVMNILHQTQVSENARTQDRFTEELINQVTQLKEFVAGLEDRMKTLSVEDREAQQEVREKFKKDIQALDTIQTNQAAFMEKFDAMESWNADVSKEFAHFREIQMPELNNVVHKHIDILRVSEQDHYNKLHKILQKTVESRCEMSEDMEELKEKLSSMKNISNDIAKSITHHTLQQLSSVTKSYENQIMTLKQHTESVNISLQEGENRLSNIRGQSEMIMKQMVLSSNKMNELEKQNHGLHDIYATINELMQDIERIKSDYKQAKEELSLISKNLKSSNDEQIDAMKQQVASMSDTLSKKIDESLEKLHEHYHIAEDDITQSVQILAKQAQLKSGYTS
jgi:chromosome segregation ATPase